MNTVQNPETQDMEEASDLKDMDFRYVLLLHSLFTFNAVPQDFTVVGVAEVERAITKQEETKIEETFRYPINIIFSLNFFYLVFLQKEEARIVKDFDGYVKSMELDMHSPKKPVIDSKGESTAEVVGDTR